MFYILECIRIVIVIYGDPVHRIRNESNEWDESRLKILEAYIIFPNSVHQF